MCADAPSANDLVDCDTNNATTIDFRDISKSDTFPTDHPMEDRKRDYFQYLNRMNSGLQNGRKWQNKYRETYTMNRNLIQCMSDTVQPSWWEEKRTIQLFDGLQRSNMGHPSHVVALSTYAYVLHRFADGRKCHPQVRPENRDPHFERCRDDFGISQDFFATVYGQVAHRIRNGELEIRRDDKYGTDPQAPQNWRTLNTRGDGWL